MIERTLDPKRNLCSRVHPASETCIYQNVRPARFLAVFPESLDGLGELDRCHGSTKFRTRATFFKSLGIEAAAFAAAITDEQIQVGGRFNVGSRLGGLCPWFFGNVFDTHFRCRINLCFTIVVN